MDTRAPGIEFGVAAGPRKDGFAAREKRHVRKGAALRAPVGEIRIGDQALDFASALIVLPKKCEALRIWVRKRAKECGIRKTKNGGVRSDAEGEGEDSGRREAGALAECAEGVAKVGQKAFDGRPLPDCAAVLFDQCDISKFAAGGGGGFFSRHAGGDEFLDPFFEVLLNLVGEIAIESAARE